MISERLHDIEPSGIRKIFDRAATAKNPVDLIMGEPDFDVPEPVKNAAIKMILLK